MIIADEDIKHAIETGEYYSQDYFIAAKRKRTGCHANDCTWVITIKLNPEAVDYLT